MIFTCAKLYDFHKQYLGSKHGSVGITDNHLPRLTDPLMPYFHVNLCAEGASSSFWPDPGLDQQVSLQISQRFPLKLGSHRNLSCAADMQALLENGTSHHLDNHRDIRHFNDYIFIQTCHCYYTHTRVKWFLILAQNKIKLVTYNIRGGKKEPF